MQIYSNQTHNATYMLTHTLGTLLSHTFQLSQCYHVNVSKIISSERKRNLIAARQNLPKSLNYFSVQILSLPSVLCTSDQSSPSSSLLSSPVRLLPLFISIHYLTYLHAAPPWWLPRCHYPAVGQLCSFIVAAIGTLVTARS